MNNIEIDVIGALLDKRQLTLYLANGTTYIIKQGNPQLEEVVKHVQKTLSKEDSCKITISDSSPVIKARFAEYAAKSNGLVRFLRIAKEHIKSIFKQEHVNPIDEIIQHSEEHSTDTLCGTETVVAIVDDVVITNADALIHQVQRANETGSDGMLKFLQRMAKVANVRRHSADELLEFMRKGDMPITDDGCILVFKRLCKDRSELVDTHTRSVRQTVGDYVYMDVSLVDDDNRISCSNGLHVARRQYLGGFSGDACILARVAPEDAIAVPRADANKMRVCGYHIIAMLTDEQASTVFANRPITDAAGGAELLGNAIRGNHIGISRTVKITGGKGTGIVTTAVPTDDTASGEMKEILAKFGYTDDLAVEQTITEPVQPIDFDPVESKPVLAPSVDPLQIAKKTATVYKDETMLSDAQQKALALVRGGKTSYAAEKESGIGRRSIDRLVARYGK